MALKDLFSRRRRASGTAQRAPASDAEPGSVSSQLDVEGRGPVTLDERTKPGGQASPDTNQGKIEPIPATPGHADPNAALPAPELGDMNIGAADPQAPSHPAARDRDVSLAGGTVYGGPINPGAVPADERPGVDPDSTSKLPEGPERPAQESVGRGQRQPGSLGLSPEEQETDVQAGAARMVPGDPPAGSRPPVPQAGDPQGVAVPHVLPAPGTSEEQSIVHGVRAAIVPGEVPDVPVDAGPHRDGTVDRDVQGRDVLHADTPDRTTPDRNTP